MPIDDEKMYVRRSGNSRVSMSTEAPEKSPAKSGVNVLVVLMDCSSADGKMSSGTKRFSGSGLGSRAPFRLVTVYRSPRPRTNTLRPSCTVTPLTR